MFLNYSRTMVLRRNALDPWCVRHYFEMKEISPVVKLRKNKCNWLKTNKTWKWGSNWGKPRIWKGSMLSGKLYKTTRASSSCCPMNRCGRRFAVQLSHWLFPFKYRGWKPKKYLFMRSVPSASRSGDPHPSTGPNTTWSLLRSQISADWFHRWNPPS